MLVGVPGEPMIKDFVARSKQAVRELRIRFAYAPLILLYHRVSDLPSDPHLLSVTKAHFAEHLEILRRHTRPMLLRDMVRALRDNNVPRRAVAVTFDDGYADNLHNAKPLLERYAVPATIYVTSGYVGASREFFHDKLEDMFLQPGKLPQFLRLTIAGNTHLWDLGDDARYSEDAYQRNRAWHILKAENPTGRHSVYRSLCQLFYTLQDDDRRETLEALATWAGSKLSCRQTYRVLEPNEVRMLTNGGLVEVGSHTMTHPVLSALPCAQQRDEIQQSKTVLEEMLGRPVMSFAYPYGARSDYTAETVSLVREAGYDHACSNFEGLVQQDTDPWQMPRFLVRDWDAEIFSRQLRKWRAL
jgi:peptidoglycan/xylan/chitin deacetylase (PgdA/CDA1 family)